MFDRREVLKTASIASVGMLAPGDAAAAMKTVTAGK
jgi:hypothetical protein